MVIQSEVRRLLARDHQQRVTWGSSARRTTRIIRSSPNSYQTGTVIGSATPRMPGTICGPLRVGLVHHHSSVRVRQSRYNRCMQANTPRAGGPDRRSAHPPGPDERGKPEAGAPYDGVEHAFSRPPRLTRCNRVSALAAPAIPAINYAPVGVDRPQARERYDRGSRGGCGPAAVARANGPSASRSRKSAGRRGDARDIQIRCRANGIARGGRRRS